MSLLDLIKGGKKKSTRQFIGAKTITDRSLETYNQGEIVFFILRPHNLAVLSKENIAYRLQSMNTILKGIPEIEMCCLNSRESFEDNKAFLRERIEAEECEAVRELCRKDIAFLDHIQLEKASAREFIVMRRFRKAKQPEIINEMNKTEKLFKDCGFDVRRADKADIQRLLAVFFEQNITQPEFDDIDGQRFATILENPEKT